jgi:hypothetical protein
MITCFTVAKHLAEHDDILRGPNLIAHDCSKSRLQFTSENSSCSCSTSSGADSLRMSMLPVKLRRLTFISDKTP